MCVCVTGGGGGDSTAMGHRGVKSRVLRRNPSAGACAEAKTYGGNVVQKIEEIRHGLGGVCLRSELKLCFPFERGCESSTQLARRDQRFLIARESSEGLLPVVATARQGSAAQAAVPAAQ